MRKSSLSPCPLLSLGNMYTYSQYCTKFKLERSLKSKKMYRMYCETIAVSTDCCAAMPTYPINANLSFAPCTTIAGSVPCQKKETKMYVDNDKHIESSKINYLTQRADNLWYTQHDKLRKQFGLIDDDAPQTAQEIVDRITSGKYVLKVDTKDKKNYDPVRYISWRDPTVKADQAGFDAAMKLFEKAKQDTMDIIAIDTPMNALAAVKALEAWTVPAVTPVV